MPEVIKQAAPDLACQLLTKATAYQEQQLPFYETVEIKAPALTAEYM